MLCLVLYTAVLLCSIELEAIEACEWLRETGFPQYAQLYRSTYTARRDTLLQCSLDFFAYICC